MDRSNNEIDAHVSRNRRYWETVARWRNRWANQLEPFQDLPGLFRSGRTTLHSGPAAADGSLGEVDLLPGVRAKRLLHLGCGTGHDSVSWASSGAHVTAIDFAWANLLNLQELVSGFPRWSLPRFVLSVHPVMADVRRLPLQTGSFDAAYIAGLVSWLPELGSLFEETRRVLRHGGLVLLVQEALRRDDRDCSTGDSLVGGQASPVHCNNMDQAAWPMPPGMQLETSDFLWSRESILEAMSEARLEPDRVLEPNWSSVTEESARTSDPEAGTHLLFVRAVRR